MTDTAMRRMLTRTEVEAMAASISVLRSQPEPPEAEGAEEAVSP